MSMRKISTKGDTGGNSESGGDVNQKALKAGTWYVVSDISVKAIAFLTMPLFTRLMSTSDYGLVATFSSWCAMLLVFGTLNLNYSIGRAKLDYPGRLVEYVGSARLLSAIVTAAVSAAALFLLEPISAFLGMSKALTLLLLAYLFFMPSVQFAQSRYRYEYRYWGNIFISAFITVFSVVFSLVLILVFDERKYLGRAVGLVLPPVLLSIFFWISSLKEKSLKANTEFWKYGLVMSLPLILHTVSLNILAQSDRVLITKYCGESMTGIYSVAYGYAATMSIVMVCMPVMPNSRPCFMTNTSQAAGTRYAKRSNPS